MKFCFRTRHRHNLCVGVLGVLVPCVSWAADWRFAPYLELGETYTDNVTLRAQADAESDYVTEINPGFSITGQGRELQLSLGYRMQNLFYANDDTRNNVNHQLQAQAHGTLAPEWLFLDANAVLSQQVLSTDDPVGFGNIASVGNREDVLATSVSPNIKTRLGPAAVGTLRYTQSQVTYSGTSVEDSVTDTVNAQISSARPLGPWTWSMEALKDDIHYSGVRLDESRESISANVGFRISYKLQLTGMLGREDNQYATVADAPATEGDFWNAGLVWTPSPRTSIALGGGHRYFGNTRNLTVSHTGRRNELQLSYLDDLFSLRQLQQAFVPSRDATGAPIIIDGVPVMEASGTLVAIDEVFVRHRGELQWKVLSRKLTFTARVFLENRDYQLSEEEERLGGGDMGWEWRASRRSSLNIGWGRQNTSRSASDDKYEFSNLGWKHTLGQGVTGTIDLRHTDRDSTAGTSDYVENLVIGRLRMTW